MEICSHVVAVSDKLGELSSFLKWFINTKQQPNVAMHGLSAGRGRKGGVPKRKRSRTTSASDVHVPRPVLTSSGKQRSTTDPLNQGRVRGSNGAHSPSDSFVTGGILSSQESMHRGCRNVSDDGDFPLPRERPVWEISDGTFPSATTSGSSAQMHTACTAPQPVYSQSASSVSAIASTLNSLLTQNQVFTFQSPPPSKPVSPNVNPFFLKAIEGCARVVGHPCETGMDQSHCLHMTLP